MKLVLREQPLSGHSVCPVVSFYPNFRNRAAMPEKRPRVSRTYSVLLTAPPTISVPFNWVVHLQK
ncbi:hypothetical protein BABINDRAFT_79020 [Babjeviella inositovora NRRL Y-12698]|uniref:Uncharacterized protein n=1 Tax=Babjeviella inositovora NRRL Y-12698 TaxID=984486 RepID=A0A1E3QZ75_9ASCO|nr:uncharacterized protein BABINDRAFT_79020 [Babjeviella inositovora NRRL Y-12698]ODQ82970.1 hypothetical protein BABINDRAFT_79020 [Babjeviella inositovora NRRL Y-12698]